MPKVTSTPDVLQRIATLEARLAELTRSTGSSLALDVPLFPAWQWGLVYNDATTFTTVWTGQLVPRTSVLSLGLATLGDQVGGVNTGGDWQALVQGTVAASGTIPATYAYNRTTTTLDLSAYLGLTSVQIDIQVRRTAGATTGGLHGGGGSIGVAPTFARLI